MATSPGAFPRSTPIVFRQTGDFAASNAAEAALVSAGFSIGVRQRHSPRGLILGEVAISKWRNLSHQERLVLDGEMHGGRDGPIIITPSATADQDVLAALEHVRAVADVEPVRLTKLVGGMCVDA